MSLVLCTGGGSAGHVVPLKPVIERLVATGHRVAYVGGRDGLEARLLEDLDVDVYAVTTGKLRRQRTMAALGRNVVDASRVLLGIVQAWRLLGRLRPDVVCSKGGFVSIPVVVAAWLRRVPVLAHESDLTPGLANRVALRVARTLCVSFAETEVAGFGGRVVHTGSPVRPALLEGSADRGRHLLGADADADPVVVVTGGSLGAEAINDAVRRAIPELVSFCHVVHVTGPGKRVAGAAHPRYHAFEFVDAGWGDLLACAAVVVSRAGANTLFELLALKKPNLLIPLPARASRGDQIDNARVAERAGYSRVLPQDELGPETLVAGIRQLLAEASTYRRRLEAFRAPDAVQAIVAELERLVTRRPAR